VAVPLELQHGGDAAAVHRVDLFRERRCAARRG
jgi:hypothetical protein